MKNSTSIRISAPARICLFGDHQDYLGLPVIACAINKRLQLTAETNDKDYFHLLMPDLKEERIIPIDERFENLPANDHYASALRVVRRHGCLPTHGYQITLRSEIPINAGVSSSSAIVVGWIHFLLVAFGCDQPITSELVAQLAYEAEVIEHDSPGGRMDQYTIGIGGTIYIETDKKLSYRSLTQNIPGMILAESGIPKQTLGVLSQLRTFAQQAVLQIKKELPHFDLKETTEIQIDALSQYVDPDLRPYFYAAVINHSITQHALKEFQKEHLSLESIGKLMNDHHWILRDVLKVTVPRIDRMINAAINAGAFGAKIVGSGGGGSIVVLASKEKKSTIQDAITKAGAIAVYPVEIDCGSKMI